MSDISTEFSSCEHRKKLVQGKLEVYSPKSENLNLSGYNSQCSNSNETQSYTPRVSHNDTHVSTKTDLVERTLALDLSDNDMTSADSVSEYSEDRNFHKSNYEENYSPGATSVTSLVIINDSEVNAMGDNYGHSEGYVYTEEKSLSVHQVDSPARVDRHSERSIDVTIKESSFRVEGKPPLPTRLSQQGSRTSSQSDEEFVTNAIQKLALIDADDPYSIPDDTGSDELYSHFSNLPNENIDEEKTPVAKTKAKKVLSVKSRFKTPTVPRSAKQESNTDSHKNSIKRGGDTRRAVNVTPSSSFRHTSGSSSSLERDHSRLLARIVSTPQKLTRGNTSSQASSSASSSKVRRSVSCATTTRVVREPPAKTGHVLTSTMMSSCGTQGIDSSWASVSRVDPIKCSSFDRLSGISFCGDSSKMSVSRVSDDSNHSILAGTPSMVNKRLIRNNQIRVEYGKDSENSIATQIKDKEMLYAMYIQAAYLNATAKLARKQNTDTFHGEYSALSEQIWRLKCKMNKQRQDLYKWKQAGALDESLDAQLANLEPILCKMDRFIDKFGRLAQHLDTRRHYLRTQGVYLPDKKSFITPCSNELNTQQSKTSNIFEDRLAVLIELLGKLAEEVSSNSSTSYQRAEELHVLLTEMATLVNKEVEMIKSQSFMTTEVSTKLVEEASIRIQRLYEQRNKFAK